MNSIRHVSSSSAQTRLIRGVAIAAAIVLGLMLVWLAISIRLFVFPERDDVAHADAIVVIGPTQDWRLDLAEQMIADGVSDTLVEVVFPPEQRGRGCSEEGDVTVMCFTPKPSTTQGEAMWTKRAAAEHGWDSVVVITQDTHIERARYIFRNCLPPDVDVAVTGHAVGMNLTQLMQQFAYQTGGFFKAMFVTPGC